MTADGKIINSDRPNSWNDTAGRVEATTSCPTLARNAGEIC